MAREVAVATLAKGFQGLIKPGSGGVGLRTCVDGIQPVMDVRSLLGLDCRRFIVNANLTPVPAGNTALGADWTVPLGKVWRVVGASLSVAVVLGSAINQVGLVAEPSEQSTGNLGIYITTPSRPLLAAAADNTHVTLAIADLWLNSGTRVLLNAAGVTTAAGITANSRLLIEEFSA